MSFTQRLLAPIADVRQEESVTALMMFAYSFLAMTAYNVIKPITRSKFISDLGADNLPYVLLAAGFLIGILMAGYTWTMARLPRRWGLPITQVGMGGMLLVFWFLFQSDATWVSVAFYIAGLILGVLLISQFWTLANIVYDPRQAKRLFGMIGGGAPLGGIAGSAAARAWATSLGSTNLLLPSAACMFLCALLVTLIIQRERPQQPVAVTVKREKAVGAMEAFDLLRQSKHLQIIALVISFAAIGAAIIEQQLNMAAEAAKGAAATDSITAFLAGVGLWTSSIGFIIQVWLTSRIHRYLGIGFALMVLPVSLGVTAVVMLLNAALWAPSLARVLDQSLRYTIDKTTREILFLPLPADIKLKAKSFVDVTVDRGAKAAGALLLLVLVQPWGLHLSWQQLSYASLSMMVLWIFMAMRARRGYLAAFRQSIERQDLRPAELRLSGADLSTIEALVQELSHPSADRVIYAIEVLESLDKRHLVTPLLLYHESARVRARALEALAAAPSDISRQWGPQIQRLLGDPDGAVRAAAVRALCSIQKEDAPALARPLLSDQDPRIRLTAAAVLADSADARDRSAADAAFVELTGDAGNDARPLRREAAAALGLVRDPGIHRLLIPLLYDPAPEVANEALGSVSALGPSEFIFVPTLVSLLHNRQLKGRAREVLVSYGQDVVPVLEHVMHDQEEDIWVRRHIPGTLAQLPSQRTVDALAAALKDPDGFLRYKAVAALERLRREHDDLKFPPEPIEALAVEESRRYFTYLSLHDNLFVRGGLPPTSVLARALEEKTARSLDRIYLLLALIHPWRDIAAVRWTLEHGDARSRASASEYLDNILTGQIRKRLMPALEDLPREEKVRRGNVLMKTRPRNVEETLLQLINDDDQIVAAAAIEVVREQQVWALADDIEHVLAHRDVRDWFVFEAASWALAEHRLGGRRRELWREPLPVAAIAGYLRGLPLFAHVSVDELFRMASSGPQTRHEPGRVLLQENEVPETVHLLLDGRVVVSGRGVPPRTLEAPAAIGLEETLAGLPAQASARTVDTSVTLALPVTQLRTLLADNTALVRGLFVTLAEAGSLTSPEVIVGADAAAQLDGLARGGLTTVEKGIALQRVPVFSRVTADEMVGLADLARAIELRAGTRAFEASSPPAIWLLLSGELALEEAPGGESRVVQAGTVLGLWSTLAGRPIGAAADVRRSGIALQIDGQDLFDRLSERPALFQQMYGRRETLKDESHRRTQKNTEQGRRNVADAYSAS
ncbi:MAG TPA: Npt1/Npt2 family nucleotide transporter [Vicinamibacterales bacterium]|nr:Npt1/Npt2 family nucleotide transporter [Vicinamibacterales bacterium]